MKKRSLVAALAMLMVSAIVLTSSTYAWFATGTTAQVTGVTAGIANDQGSITISANGTDYVTALVYDDFKIAGNLVPETHIPVSWDPTATDDSGNFTEKFISGTISQDDADASPTKGKMLFNANETATGYTKIQVYVKSDANCKVDVAATIAADYGFYYGAIRSGKQVAVYTTASQEKTYKPVVTATNGVDVNFNNYMDEADKLSNGTENYTGLGSPVTGKTSGSAGFTLELVADEAQIVTLYVWAEGNDSACSGSVTDTVLANLQFTKQTNA